MFARIHMQKMNYAWKDERKGKQSNEFELYELFTLKH